MGGVPSDHAAPAPGADRPTGRDAVRRSILRAARRRFALEGRRASLRDIADDAGVNVGLIHRHFGRKDELIREVIEHTLATSTRHAGPRGTASAMFRASTDDTDFVRMVAWLALESGPDAPSPLADAPQRTIEGLRTRPGDPDHDARLMTALTVIYGWALFSREMLSAFGIDDDRRGEFERRIAALIATLTEEDAP